MAQSTNSLALAHSFIAVISDTTKICFDAPNAPAEFFSPVQIFPGPVVLTTIFYLTQLIFLVF